MEAIVVVQLIFMTSVAKEEGGEVMGSGRIEIRICGRELRICQCIDVEAEDRRGIKGN